MDTCFTAKRDAAVNYDCFVKLHRLQITENESPSNKRQFQRSQRLKVERKRESKSPEEREPVKKRVRREGHQRLSQYELQRLENIRQNKAFLCFLKLPQVIDELRRKQKPSQRAIKNMTAVKVLPPRKSLRLQKSHSEGFAAAAVPTVAARPIQMNPLNVDGNSRLPEGLIKLWTEASHIKQDQDVPNLKRYQEQLTRMSIDASAVAKVVNKCVFSAAFHPSSSSLLMAAGDSSGKVGLWAMDANWGKAGVLLFEPHSRAVSCLAFSSAQPTNLLTVSNDGSARSMDLERALFEEVYRSDYGLKSFDFLSVDCSTLLIAHRDGDVVIVDRRTPGTSYEQRHTLDANCVYSVHVHPLRRQYFVAAESRSANIYDCRHMKMLRSPVSTLSGHFKPVSSAFFSPCTGKRVLTSCLDGMIRVFNTSTLVTYPPLSNVMDFSLSAVRKQRAVWDPKKEDCFVTGSIFSRPHQIQVRHKSGRLLHSFQHVDHVTTLCPAIAIHPNRPALLGGNVSGRLHVFSCRQ